MAEKKPVKQSLTEEDKVLMEVYAERGLKVACGTEPADKPTAEEGVGLIYDAIGHKLPHIVWVSSPLQCAIVSSLIGSSESEGDKKFHKLAYQDSKANLQDYVDTFLSSEKGKLDNVKKKHRKTMQDSLRNFCWGNHEYHWVQFYKFCDEVNIPYDKSKAAQLPFWEKVDSSAGWWSPYDGVVVMCDRPSAFNIDTNRDLHCENGPAVQYRDGWTIWAIEGHVFDEKVVMRPHEQTLAEINGEENADMKAIRIKRYNWDRYIKDSGMRCIDQRHNDIEGMKEALFRVSDDECRLVVSCPTGRVFAIAVPGEMNKCADAQKWLNPRPVNVIGRT